MEILVLIGLSLLVLFIVHGRNGNRSSPLQQARVIEKPVVRPNPERKPSPKRIQHHTKGIEHAPPPEVPTSRKLKGKAWVIDGDTIVVSKIKVRLAGIDAPELDQPWGQKAKWEMVKICKGHIIDVELTGDTTYDRLVGTCYLADGTDIGAELIKAGLALDGGHFSHGKYRHLEPEGIRKRLKFYGHWRK